MKKIKLSLLGLMLSATASAQVYTDPANGSVGIGTTTPVFKLDVNGNLMSRGSLNTSIAGNDIGGTIYINNPAKIGSGVASVWAIYNMSGNYGNSLQFWAYDNVGCAGGLCNSRFTLMDNGNVGIGANNPSDKLQIEGNQFSLRNAVTNNGLIFNVNAFGHPAIIPSNGDGTVDKNLLIAPYGGNVGVGTASPTTKLEVTTGNNYDQLSLTKNTLEGDKGAGIVFKNVVNNGSLPEIAGIQAKLLDGSTGYVKGSLSMYTVNNETKIEALTIRPQGNVGIGIATPDEKLAVNGKIRAKEIKVEASNWPDYVFEEDYKVGTLEALESYIKANKHLPEMPSAEEVAENGVQLGEMNKLLLKKIEELTLQLIEVNKKVDAQQIEIRQLSKKSN